MAELKLTKNPCKYCNGEIDEGRDTDNHSVCYKEFMTMFGNFKGSTR